MIQSVVYATVRTPFGRFGDAPAGSRPDHLASVTISGTPDTVPALDHHSGGRNLGTLSKWLADAGDRWGLAAICIGAGQGLAVLLENWASRNTASKGARS